MTCTEQLRKVECPICKSKLKGGYLTKNIENIIESSEKEDIYIKELTDVLYAEYLNRYNNQREARMYSEAFNLFLINNSNITKPDAIRIFLAFIKYISKEREKTPTLTLLNGITKFSTIGLIMLNDPTAKFNQIYNLFQ